MRIVGQRIAQCQLLLDVGGGQGRVLDSYRQTVTLPRPMSELRAEAGWVGYLGPQRVASLLANADEVE